MNAAALVRRARAAAGLTQADLAQRMGTTQSAVARLESPASNPRLETLDRALRAAGQRLEFSTVSAPQDALDEVQLKRHVEMTPAERVAAHDVAYRGTQRLMARARLA
jgi:transcriptional regulator with XRE-family HTH domain